MIQHEDHELPFKGFSFSFSSNRPSSKSAFSLLSDARFEGFLGKVSHMKVDSLKFETDRNIRVQAPIL